MSPFTAIVVALCALAGSAVAQAGAAADNPLAWAESRDVIRGSFLQEKHLADLEQALVSRGTFLVAREHGLLWRVEHPFETTLIVDGQHIVQRVEGRQTLRLNRDEQPGLSIVAAVLVGIFQADLDRLRNFFAIHVTTKEEGGWQLAMQPTADGVAEFVTRLTVIGRQNDIERIEIDEPGGDRSVIRLQVAPNSTPLLTPQERSEFLD